MNIWNFLELQSARMQESVIDRQENASASHISLGRPAKEQFVPTIVAVSISLL